MVSAIVLNNMSSRPQVKVLHCLYANHLLTVSLPRFPQKIRGTEQLTEVNSINNVSTGNSITALKNFNMLHVFLEPTLNKPANIIRITASNQTSLDRGLTVGCIHYS